MTSVHARSPTHPSPHPRRAGRDNASLPLPRLPYREVPRWCDDSAAVSGAIDTSAPKPGDSQRGGASIIALGLGLCLLLFALAGAGLAGAVEARHRAQIGADAAALAGAMRVAQGATSACERAGQLAAANHARVTECRLSGSDITVEVAVALPKPLRVFGSVRSLARAGPVGTSTAAETLDNT